MIHYGDVVRPPSKKIQGSKISNHDEARRGSVRNIASFCDKEIHHMCPNGNARDGNKCPRW